MRNILFFIGLLILSNSFSQVDTTDYVDPILSKRFHSEEKYVSLKASDYFQQSSGERNASIGIFVGGGLLTAILLEDMKRTGIDPKYRTAPWILFTGTTLTSIALYIGSNSSERKGSRLRSKNYDEWDH